MKAMRVVPMRTYQHLYIKHHAYTMYPVWNMHPLILYTLHHCHPADTPHYDTQPSPLRPVCCCLMFLSDSSESDQDPDSPLDSSPDSSSDDKEDFQMVPIDDEHWTTEMVPERTFCIHEDGLPNNVCQYPCPYGINNNSVSYMDSLEISDISNYKDYMMTTSNDEELPGLEEVPY